MQWETKVEMAVLQRQQHHLPLRLGVPSGLLPSISGNEKSKARLSLVHWSNSFMLRRGLLGLVQQCLPAMASKCSKEAVSHWGWR